MIPFRLGDLLRYLANESLQMGGIKGTVLGILCYGSLLLTPFCLIGLSGCAVFLLAGQMGWKCVSRSFPQSMEAGRGFFCSYPNFLYDFRMAAL